MGLWSIVQCVHSLDLWKIFFGRIKGTDKSIIYSLHDLRSFTFSILNQTGILKSEKHIQNVIQRVDGRRSNIIDNQSCKRKTFDERIERQPIEDEE